MTLPVERKRRENLVVYGQRYDKEICKITLPSGRKIMIYGSTYQYGCDLATNSSMQTRESAIAQGATPEQLKIIGEGEYIGPPLNESMSIVRVYTLGIMVGRYLQLNPKTKENGIKVQQAVEETLRLQSPLYNIDWKNLKLNP